MSVSTWWRFQEVIRKLSAGSIAGGGFFLEVAVPRTAAEEIAASMLAWAASRQVNSREFSLVFDFDACN